MDYLSLKKQAGSENKHVVHVLNDYLCLLRAAYIIHQNSHWTCSGPNFYSSHLLFQRLYESTTEKTDELAEKIVGLFSNKALLLQSQPSKLENILSKFDNDDPLDNSFHIEQTIFQFLEKEYENIKSNITKGLDDMWMSHQHKTEESLYLLKQSR
jgi:starvation-inducible DNA-binding protein